MSVESLSYLEWLFLRWASEQPRHRFFYLTGEKVVSQYDFTPDASKVAKAMVQRGLFVASDLHCYRINQAGIELAISASAPSHGPLKIPPIASPEHAALNALYDAGAAQDWVSLSSLSGVSRTRMVVALQSLVANDYAIAIAYAGSAEIFSASNVLLPTLFKHSRFSWKYKLTDQGVEKLCELDLADDSKDVQHD